MPDANVTEIRKEVMFPLTSGERKALLFLVQLAQEQHHCNLTLQRNVSWRMLDKLENKLEEKKRKANANIVTGKQIGTAHV